MKKSLMVGVMLMAFLPMIATAKYVIGDTVLDFTLNDTDGNPVNLYSFIGKVVWLNIFQTT